MIYVTGDCHGDFHRFAGRNAPALQGLTKQDYVIICGDFGGVWEQTETSAELPVMIFLVGFSIQTRRIIADAVNFSTGIMCLIGSSICLGGSGSCRMKRSCRRGWIGWLRSITMWMRSLHIAVRRRCRQSLAWTMYRIG